MAYRPFKFVIQPFLLDDDDREHAAEPVIISGGMASLTNWIEKFPGLLDALNTEPPDMERLPEVTR